MLDIVELFVLKNAAITADLRETLSKFAGYEIRSEVEIATDKLVEAHIAQIDSRIRRNTMRMAEFYRIFYVLENDIRSLVQDTLSEAKGDDWWNLSIPQEVKQNAQKDRERESNEGLAPRSGNMIDYTTFGELGEIIRNNWDVFAGVFGSSDKNRVLRVINRLNLVRGPIAHCGLLIEEEIVRLKLTVRDWYKLTELITAWLMNSKKFSNFVAFKTIIHFLIGCSFIDYSRVSDRKANSARLSCRKRVLHRRQHLIL